MALPKTPMVYRLPFVAGSALLLVFLLVVDANPSGGARGDLFSFHIPTIEIYKESSWVDALLEQRSAMGPLSYMIFSQFNFSVLTLRIISSLILWVSGLIALYLLLSLCPRRDPKAEISCQLLIFSIFFLNPWTLGPALWANPDTLAIFFLLVCFLILSKRYSMSFFLMFISGLFFSFAVLTRQSSIAVLAPFLAYYIAANSVKTLEFRQALLISSFLIMPLLVFSFLLFSWGGMTPPAFNRHMSISLTPVTYVIAYFGLVSFPLTVAYLYMKRSWKAVALGVPVALFLLLVTASLNELPTSGGSAVGKLLELGAIGEIAWFAIFMFGVWTLVVMVRSVPMVGVLVLLYFLSFSVMGEIFYQKYLEPTIVLLAVANCFSLFKVSFISLQWYSVYVAALYGGFLGLAIMVYS